MQPSTFLKFYVRNAVLKCEIRCKRDLACQLNSTPSCALVESNYTNFEDYGRLIDFQSQISKLSNFNGLDANNYMIHH